MITILLPCSRPDFLDTVFASLEFLDCGREEVNLLTIVDGDNELFVNVRNRTETSKFGERLCVQFPSDEPMRNYNFMRRRHRISAIHNFAKQHIKKCHYIWCIEDDGQFRPDALKKLLHHYTLLPFAGLVSGVELGRWGIPCIGGWDFNDIYLSLIHI